MRQKARRAPFQNIFIRPPWVFSLPVQFLRLELVSIMVYDVSCKKDSIFIPKIKMTAVYQSPYI